MKSCVNLFLCAGLYIRVVILFPMKLLLKSDSVKQKMIKNGFLKMKKNGEMNLSRYYDLLCKTQAPVYLHAHLAYFMFGLCPFWMMINKQLTSLPNVELMLDCLPFAIPLIWFELFVIKDDTWMKYWRQIVGMTAKKRKRLIIYTCITKVCLLILYIVVFIVCIPIINSM